MPAAYAILGLEPGAGPEEIISAYRQLMLRLDLRHFFGTPLFTLARKRQEAAEQAFRQAIAPYISLIGTKAVDDILTGYHETGIFSAMPWTALYRGPGINDPQNRGNRCERYCDWADNCSDCSDCDGCDCSGCDNCDCGGCDGCDCGGCDC